MRRSLIVISDFFPCPNIIIYQVNLSIYLSKGSRNILVTVGVWVLNWIFFIILLLYLLMHIFWFVCLVYLSEDRPHFKIFYPVAVEIEVFDYFIHFLQFLLCWIEQSFFAFDFFLFTRHCDLIHPHIFN